MLKLVLFGALLALAAAAPQFPFYPGYHPYSLYNYSPFPYMRNPFEVPPLPFSSPYGYSFNYPYQPSYYSAFPQLGQQEQNADQAPPASPAPVSTFLPAKEGAEVPVVTSNPPLRRPTQDKGELSIESAKLYLTPEQQVLFEAAVAAMNPLEYAAQLDSVTNPHHSTKDPQHVQPPAPANEGIEIPVVTSTPPRFNPKGKGELTLENAKVYLTPEQRVLFEAAVASMNPLEYAAQLDGFKNA